MVQMFNNTNTILMMGVFVLLFLLCLLFSSYIIFAFIISALNHTMSEIFMIGNYGFQLVGKKTMEDTKQTAVRGRELMKNAPVVMYYVAAYSRDRRPVLTTLRGRKRTPPDESGKPLIFAVYMSESQMGFCRLASFKLGSVSLNKGPDYAQSSLINFKLGNFILQNLNHQDIIQYPVTDPAGVPIGSPYPDQTFSDELSYYDYLLEPNVVDKARIKGDITHASEKCGEMTPRISSYLKQTSRSLQTQFHTMAYAEVICNHAHSTSFANVDGTIFKVVLQSSDLSKNIEMFVYKYTVQSATSTGDEFTFSGTIPVLVKEPNLANPEDIEDITEVGTYANYIPTGAYVCKLFEYNLQLTAIMMHTPTEEEKEIYATQVTSKIIKVNDQYSFVGQLFNGLYPTSQLEEFLKSQGQGGAHKKKHKPKPTRRHRHHRRTRTPKRSRKLYRKK